MYRHLRLAVVIPAYNENRAIADTIAAVPSFADHIFVVSNSDLTPAGRALSGKATSIARAVDTRYFGPQPNRLRATLRRIAEQRGRVP